METKIEISLTQEQIAEFVRRGLLGLATPPAASPGDALYAPLLGQRVVVRSHMSGVWWGRLSGVAGGVLVLTDARRAWSWTGALSCSGLALRGPTGGRIEAPVPSTTIPEHVEILGPCTSEADAAWSAVAPWVRS